VGMSWHRLLALPLLVSLFGAVALAARRTGARGEQYDLVLAGGRVAVPTGLAFEIPAGFEGQVRPRSGLARKVGITILNAPGTIDSDYRGEVQVLLVNLGDAPHVIQPGDRIAQLVIAPVSMAELEEATELAETPRGAGGFGHTG